MGPKGLLNDDGNYILQHKDIYDLFKYVQTGVLLPTDTAEYQRRLHLSDEMFQRFSSVVAPLVTAYDRAQLHCQRFKDIIYPGIVSLSSDVYDYASKAGGARYSMILRLVRELAEATSPMEEVRVVGRLNRVVDVQITSINDLTTKAQACINNLRVFEGETMSDQSELRERNKDVDAMLSLEQGSVNAIRTQLNNLKNELKTVSEEFETARISECAALKFAWVFPFGLVPSAALASAGRKAAQLGQRLNKVRELINDNEGKLREAERITAHMMTIDADLDNVVALIAPAVTTVQEMMGVWDAVKADLERLKNMDHREANWVIASIIEHKALEKWQTLADGVGKYQKAAYMSDAELKSFADLSAEYGVPYQMRSVTIINKSGVMIEWNGLYIM